MEFQVIDSNGICKKVFINSDIVDLSDKLNLTKTWKHSVHLSGACNADYAMLYGDGTYDSLCPSYLKESWGSAHSRVASIMKSVINARCDLENTCVYDYVPHNFLMKFLSAKSIIIGNTFENVKKPKHYDILREAHILTEEMNSNLNTYGDKKGRTNYNIFGTKTGRLSNKKSAIPILTMKKEDRHMLKPSNDLFVEFDFNAAELRTLLALSGKNQPQIDIHNWNVQQVVPGISREDMKKRIFAWLYNPEARDSVLERLYDRNGVKSNYWNGSTVRTPFFRNIETDDRRALNYIVQSTSSDVCIEQAFKLRKLFHNKRTKICYLLHDSVILDFAKEDRHLFLEAREAFSDTRFGKYVVNSAIGKNFGDMRVV